MRLLPRMQQDHPVLQGPNWCCRAAHGRCPFNSTHQASTNYTPDDIDDFVERLSAKSDVSAEDESLPTISNRQKKRLLNLIALWLAGSLRPYSVVEDPGFVALLNFVASDVGGVRLKVPGRATVSKAVERQARKLRALLKVRIAKTCDYYSLTTDAWTDRTTRSFVALTLHYLDEDFVMRDWVLEVESFPGKHSGEAIRDKLNEALTRWGLDKAKCTTLMRDGASNVTKGSRLLGVSHMTCMAHSLHLVVAGALIREKGELVEERVQQILRAERGKDRQARDAREVDEALAVAAAVEAASEAAPSASVVEAALSRLEAATASRSSDTDGNAAQQRGADINDHGPSHLDGNMASSWNAVRDEACDEIETHLQSVDPDAKDGLEYARKNVQVFRTLAVYLRKSAKAKNRMIIERQKVQDDKNKYISLDCPTRWNSCMDMLQIFSDLKATVNSFFDYLSTADGKKEFERQTLQRPTPENWFVLRCLLALLCPFKAVTEDSVGASIRRCRSQFIPALRQIKLHILKLTLFDTAVKDVKGYIFADEALTKMHKVRQTFLALFLDRFANVASDLTWISSLDPRLTDLAHLRPEEKAQAQLALIDALLEVEVVPPAPRPRVTHPPQPSNTPQKVRQHVRLGIFGSRAVEFESPPVVLSDITDVRAACQQEVQGYLAAAKDVLPKVDPLEWWRAHATEFPRMAQLARRWLGCVATSVPSERAFSTSGRVVSVHRCSLKEELVHDTVFIATNMKKKKK